MGNGREDFSGKHSETAGSMALSQCLMHISYERGRKKRNVKRGQGRMAAKTVPHSCAICNSTSHRTLEQEEGHSVKPSPFTGEETKNRGVT